MPLIEVEELTKIYRIHRKEPGLWGSVQALYRRRYEDQRAVDRISFQVEEGEVIGFLGPNGAGKTTTLKMLSGLLYPTSGSAKVLGFTPHERRDEFRQQFSLVIGQKNQLWWDLPALDSFLLHKEIYRISTPRFHQVVEELATLLQVKDQLKVQVRKLSLGERMKMELIAALLHSPRLLFLDEPSIGLDVIGQKAIRDFIRQYNHDRRSTILLTSHYMNDIKELCQRVLILNGGRILFDGPLGQIIERFTTHKFLTFVFDGPEVDRGQLESYGELVHFSPPRATLKVFRKEVPAVSEQILSRYRIQDLNVEDVSIEEIIRDVYRVDRSGKPLAL